MTKKQKPKKAATVSNKKLDDSKHILTKEEKDTLLIELVGSDLTVKQVLRNIGIVATVEPLSLEEFLSELGLCAHCKSWNLLSDLNLDMFCESCTAEVTAEEMRSYDSDNFDDYYYDGGDF